MGGGNFMFAADSAAMPPFSAARSFPTPATCTGCQPNIFGPVPSRAEVETAILQLQRFMGGVSTTKAVVEGYDEQVYQHHHHHHHYSNMLQSHPKFVIVSDAFAMMQAEPPLHSLVMSISCDKAVWEAILSNKEVDELRRATSMNAPAGEEVKQLRYPEEGELAEIIWRWIIGFTKSRVIEMVEKFVSLVSKMFIHGPSRDNPNSELNHLLEEKLRSSLLLSVIVLLIVIITRGQHDNQKI